MEYFKDLQINFKNKLILLDVDGTITLDSKDDISSCIDKIKEIKKMNNEILLCSNSKNRNRILNLSKALSINFINSIYKKPNINILKSLSPDQKLKNIIVIGDKYSTDGLLAKRINASYLKVRRLSSVTDSFKVKIINMIDDFLFFILNNFLNLKILRPIHWTKNLLIFAPLFFSKQLFILNNFSQAILLFFSFSALASSIYVFNDLKDIDEDKKHPFKKFRPLASGKMTKPSAYLLLICLILISIFLSINFRIETVFFMGIYLLMNVLYSSWLKRIPVVEIFMVAFMYLIRIYAGGSLFNIKLSSWIILCTFFLALFLIIAKRRSEFNLLNLKNSSRKVLKSYSLPFLNSFLIISTTLCLISYFIYLVNYGNSLILYSFFFVLFGLIRYLYLIFTYNAGETPEILLIKDPWIICCVLSWIVFNSYILYL